MVEPARDTEYVLTRFNRLMKDVREGNWQRTSFAPWEIELLLDIASCAAETRRRSDLLARYQKAVERRLSQKCEMPMKLSEYLEGLRTRHAERTATRASQKSDCSPALS